LTCKDLVSLSQDGANSTKNGLSYKIYTDQIKEHDKINLSLPNADDNICPMTEKAAEDLLFLKQIRAVTENKACESVEYFGTKNKISGSGDDDAIENEASESGDILLNCYKM